MKYFLPIILILVYSISKPVFSQGEVMISPKHGVAGIGNFGNDGTFHPIDNEFANKFLERDGDIGNSVYFFSIEDKKKGRSVIFGNWGKTLDYAQNLGSRLREDDDIYLQNHLPADTTDLSDLDKYDIPLEKHISQEKLSELLCGIDNQYCVDDSGEKTVVGKQIDDVCDDGKCVQIPVQCIACCWAGATCCNSCRSAPNLEALNLDNLIGEIK
jgi:hypothetical protein